MAWPRPSRLSSWISRSVCGTRKSLSAGSNLFVAASQAGKRRRDEVTPGSDSASDDAVFRNGSSPSMFSQELSEMFEFLEGRQARPTSKDSSCMLTCMNSIFRFLHLVEDVDIKTAPEKRTLPLGMGAITADHFPQVAVLLKQRFRALEMAATQRTRRLQFGVGDGIRWCCKLGVERGRRGASDPTAQFARSREEKGWPEKSRSLSSRRWVPELSVLRPPQGVLHLDPLRIETSVSAKKRSRDRDRANGGQANAKAFDETEASSFVNDPA